MYRHGHGDCFLLATRKRDGTPFYMLIDCGLKRASEIKPGNTIDKVIKHIGEATGNHLDVVLITHEHEDHVNGFLAKSPRARTRRCWDAIAVDQLWLAWTEDGDDELANELRERFDDTLLGLIDAAGQFALTPGRADALGRIEELLAFETGAENPSAELKSAAEDLRAKDAGLSERDSLVLALAGRKNKEAMQYMRGKVGGPPVFLRPDQGPYALEGVDGIRIFALGPPRSEALLLSLDPRSHEEFKLGLSLDGASRSLFSAAQTNQRNSMGAPFRPRHGLRLEDPDQPSRIDENAEVRSFFAEHYGAPGAPDADEWRRIDGDWLMPGENLALRLNSEVNNTSLVIAIELAAAGKVLLFTGDAQRGSWISWRDLSWDTAPGETVTSRDLLARTVFYKVGHHGSHNATLKGTPGDNHPNLGWMAQGNYSGEFTAMIPSNEEWALARRPWPWRHPLKAIEKALLEKARGKVFQTNRDRVERPQDINAAEWQRFTQRIAETDLYFDCTVTNA